jgi:hypothetical protein
MPIELNRENFQKVLDKIESDPSCWKQDTWHCGTKHCFAGWAQVLSGKPVSNATVRRDARIFLGLTYTEANYLFSPYRKMQDFRDFLAGETYNRDGYNRDGYNRDGYNHDGYNRAGYNRAGYNRDGYNHDGYDRDGYDRDGLNASNEPRP